MDQPALHYLQRIRTGTQKLSTLINDLLELSRVGRRGLRKESINLTNMARGVISKLRRREPQRQVAIEIADGLSAIADAHLLSIVLANLLGKAWKFTANRPLAQITFDRKNTEHGTVFYVRDNGAGFDLAHAGKLFAPFQRMHADSEFEGTGIGLASAHRAVSRHGGRLWAEAAVDAGATFHFTPGDV